MEAAAAAPPAEALKLPRSEPLGGRSSSDEARQSHVVTPAQALRELFDAADADGNGTLEAEEIAKFCEELRPSKEMSAREVALAMAAMGAGDAPGGHVTREQFETWWWTAGYRTLEERAEFASAAGRADRRQSLHALFRTLPQLAYSCTPCACSRPGCCCHAAATDEAGLEDSRSRFSRHRPILV